MCHEAIAPASDFGIGCVRRGCGWGCRDEISGKVGTERTRRQ